MSITLTEPIVDALVARLTDDLPTHVAALNSGAPADRTIEDPQQVLDHVPTPALLTAFPTIGIGDGRSTFEDDTSWSATGRHELLVVVFLQDADQGALARRLRRYSQAIVRTVLADRNLGGAAWGTGLVGVYPGDALADHSDPEQVASWMSWTGLRLWAKVDEDA